MTKKELEAILWHEKYHLDNHDSIISFVARAGAFIFPLFPLFSDLLNQYKLEREIRADTNALQKVGSKKVILTAFRKLIESPSYSLLLGQSFADATLEERIKTLLQIKLSRKNIKKRNLFISFVSIIALITALAAPVHAFEVHSRKQDAMMVCLQGGTCATWCEEHNTIIPYSQNTSHEEILSRPYSPAF